MASNTVMATDSDGRVTFNRMNSSTLTAQLEGAAAPVFVASSFTFTAPVNAASGAPGLSPGGIATIYGSNLSNDAQVLLDGRPAPVLFRSDRQVNFLVPLDQGVGATRVTVVAGGASADLPATVTLVSPGIFFDPATGYGAILKAGTALTTKDHPAARGDFVEIYATGLGPAGLPPIVTIGGVAAEVIYSGASGYPGVYQVDAQIPNDAPIGEQPLWLTISDMQSNIVKIGVR
jgi:uncharacterized protein (TIGR03437 family)